MTRNEAMPISLKEFKGFAERPPDILPGLDAWVGDDEDLSRGGVPFGGEKTASGYIIDVTEA